MSHILNESIVLPPPTYQLINCNRKAFTLYPEHIEFEALVGKKRVMCLGNWCMIEETYLVGISQEYEYKKSFST